MVTLPFDGHLTPIGLQQVIIGGGPCWTNRFCVDVGGKSPSFICTVCGHELHRNCALVEHKDTKIGLAAET